MQVQNCQQIQEVNIPKVIWIMFFYYSINSSLVGPYKSQLMCINLALLENF